MVTPNHEKGIKNSSITPKKEWAQMGWKERVEDLFEASLFSCRFIVLLAVLGAMVGAVILFLKGCIELVQAANAFIAFSWHFQPSTQDDKQVLLSIVPALDYYLFGTVLLIFSMGIYELFISEIDPRIRTGKTKPLWLHIEGLDDLKSHVGKVLMMILVVNFFRQAFNINYNSPADLIYLAGAIVLVSLSFLVTQTIRWPFQRPRERKTEE